VLFKLIQELAVSKKVDTVLVTVEDLVTECGVIDISCFLLLK
jgi:hypothetical protein